LDADVIAIADITKNLQFSESLPYHAMGIEKFESWFRASANALQIDFAGLVQDHIQYAMGVTPEFLWSKTVASMLAHLETLAGNPAWGRHLMGYFKDYDSTWTEYSLYWIWYIYNDKQLSTHYRTNLYQFVESAEFAGQKLLESPTCLFAVLQSTKLTIADCGEIYNALNGQTTAS
jgi:hypothetical protein